MNRGDTVALMLNYQINGTPLTEDGYQEIELQINNETASKSIKKLLSQGDIVWETLTYSGGTFTGYVVHLDQNETFLLRSGESQVQLRVKKDGEVGSSDMSEFDLGDVLSQKVL